jgi:hypothetical protein
MSPLYLYALLAEPPSGALPAGLAGEAMRLVPCDGVLAAVGEVGEAPPLDGSALRAHDAAVRRLAAVSSAILPARFGSLVRDEAELGEALHPRLAALRDALAAVRGCEQMTLRFSWLDSVAPTEESSLPSTATAGGPGTRYLSARRAVAGDPRSVPEVARVLDALSPLVRGERRERHGKAPLVASVYHLVPHGGLDAYRAAVEAAASREPRIRVTASGPWPPYAFAPDELA